MSLHPGTPPSATAGDGDGAQRNAPGLPNRTRETIVATGLMLGSAMVAFALMWHPWPERNDLSYASFATRRDAAWVGALIDHAGFALVAIALPIAVCMLVTARGATVANIGAGLTAIGGALFASGFYALVVLAWYATAPDAIPPAEGASLMTYVEANKAHFLGPQAAGLLSFSVGVILLAIALRRAGTTPRWLPIAIIVLTVAQFLSPTAAQDVVQTLHMGTLAAVGWCLVRSRRQAPATASIGILP